LHRRRALPHPYETITLIASSRQVKIARGRDMTRCGTRIVSACALASAFISIVGCGGSTPAPTDAGRDGNPRDVRDVASEKAGDTTDVSIIDAADSGGDVPATPDAPGDLPATPDAPDAGLDVTTVDLAPDVGPIDAPATPDAPDAAVDGTTTDGGAVTSFNIPDVIKLVPDPAAGLIYALTITQVVVFDVAQKKEVTRVALGAISTDLDLSPDGSLLVAAQDRSVRLAVIDKQAWTVTYVAVRADPQKVEAMNGNVAYYATLDQFTEVHQVDLRFGTAADVKLNLSSYEPDIELSAAGDRLFVGESSLTGSDMYAEDLTVAPARMADKSTWDGDYGFPSPPRHVYLGPSGKYVYYAGHQLEANRLPRALGDLGKVFAEDAAATFAVSERGIIDVKLRTVVAPFSTQVTTATLAAADSEVWFFEPYSGSGRLSYAKVADLLSGKTLGVRETAAAPISAYKFSKIVADPVRARLYGLDAAQSVLVSVDSATGTALRAAVIEYSAKDFEIDSAGKYIYVGHSGMAIEQIDAESLALVKYIFAPRDSYDIAVLSNDRIATIDWDQWTTATIIDTTSGAVSSAFGSWQAAIASTRDGKTLFVGSTDNPTDYLSRYDVTAGTFASGTKSGDLPTPARSVVVAPDGTSVYYGNACLNGSNLAQVRYQQTDRILSISPNSVLAASATKIYRVSDGTVLMTLPSACPIQAIGSDSGTLHCYGSAGITRVSLAGLQ